MLMDQIKKDWTTARKARETTKAILLSTLYSEALAVGKNDGNRLTTDEEVISKTKKFVKDISETIDRLENEDSTSYNSFALAGAVTKFTQERNWLEVYLPKQLTEKELLAQITLITENPEITSVKQMGLVMKELNENFYGRFDGKKASEFVRGMLVK